MQFIKIVLNTFLLEHKPNSYKYSYILNNSGWKYSKV